MRATILSEKGTTSKQVEVEPSQWSGHEFYVVQEKFMSSLPKGTIIALGKGTGRILAGDYPKSLKRVPTSGVTVSTGKGTSSYRLP